MIKTEMTQFKYIKLFLFLITLIFYKYAWSSLAIWREDEAVTLWLALVNNLLESPFGNVSSTGLPNPNFSVIISKLLTIFNSFVSISLFLSIFQMMLIYFALSSKNYEFNLLLISFLGFSMYMTYLTSSIWYQFMIISMNALFLKLIFDYIFEKKYYLATYFPVFVVLPASLYLGGLSNSIIFSLFFLFVIVFNWKNFYKNFSNVKHILFSIFLFISILRLTWYQYFTNLDFELLKIQSGSQLFPYSRIRDYLYVGFQYIKETPHFFTDIFSSTESIYFLYSYSDKLTDKTLQLIDLTLLSHKALNGIFVIIFFGSVLLLFTSYKEKINKELVYKNLFVLTFVFSFTIITPLIGGRQFLQFDIMALSVFASAYVCFLFVWISIPFIFKELKFINFFLKAFLYAAIFLNILTSFYLSNDYLNSQSSFLSEADESSVYKQEIVDFIAAKTGKEVDIYYDLGGGIYDWIPDFNEKNYSSDYYKNSFSLGRDFDYLLKRKYNIDNVNEGVLNRSPENSQFFLSYSFEDLPTDVYRNFNHYQFGNYIVTANLDY